MTDKERIYDLAIIGCGPAGISAAINARARNLDFILLGSKFCSPKLAQAPEVKNYPGFSAISGEELRQKYLQHLKDMDIPIKRAKVDNIYDQGHQYSLLSRDQSFMAKTIILAVGVSNEKYLKGEEELVGKGVSYCATCDGPLYKNRTITVIINTEEGLEDLAYLSEIAAKIYLLTDLDIEEELPTNVEPLSRTPEAITGKEQVEKIVFKDGSSLDIEGVFIFRKVTPPDKLMPRLAIEADHIKVAKNMATSENGVFAAGDCAGLPYQIAKAVGEGQIAALSVASYLYKNK